ncbi:MAG: DNRLRE domain-containing protein [Bacteroidales bacterium]|nr:DNRLRE domain-containing protein [Bacteroidales bacterium]
MKTKNIFFTAIFCLIASVGLKSQIILTDTIYIDKDATVSSAYELTNFGDSEFLESYLYNGKISERRRSYVQFDISGIPMGAHINSARLHLFGMGHTGKNESFLQMVRTEWDENTVNFKTQPALMDDNVIMAQSNAPEQNYQVEIEHFIEMWVNMGVVNNGLCLRIANVELNLTNGLKFGSSDYSLVERRPFVVVEYEVEVQPGETCVSAIPLSVTDSCEYENFLINNESVWIGFVADSSFALANLLNTENLTSFKLYSGECSSLDLLMEKNDSFGSIYLDNLIIGQDYFIEISGESNSDFEFCLSNLLKTHNVPTPTFLCPEYCLIGDDLIIDGEFDNSYFEEEFFFETDYGTVGTDCPVMNSGCCIIEEDANLAGPDWTGNSGSGLVSFFIDLHPDLPIIWKQSSEIESNTSYYFRFLTRCVNFQTTTTEWEYLIPEIGISINGNPVELEYIIDDILTNSNSVRIPRFDNANTWIPVCVLWYSDNVEGQVDFEITNMRPDVTHSSGNDLGIDAIQLHKVNIVDFEIDGETELCETNSVNPQQSTELTVINPTGTPPFSYLWSTGSTEESIIVSPFPYGSTLTSVTYHVTVTDADGCLGFGEITVNKIELDVNIIGDNNFCLGETLILNSEVSGGTPDYQYHWYGGGINGYNSFISVSPTSSTTYSLIVEDNNGCSNIDNISINVNPTPQISISSNNICPGQCNGDATVTLGSGTTPPMTYQWSNGATSQNLTNLCAGTYSVTATNTFGCSTTESVTINEYPQTMIFGINVTNENCSGDCHGSATIMAMGAGTLTYSLSNGTNNGTDNSFDELCSGLYTVTVTDGNGCTVSSDFEIGFENEVSVSFEQTYLDCPDDCDGELTVFANGIAPASVLWSNGATTQTIQNLCAGIYQVTVTDINGCTAVSSSEITGDPSIYFCWGGTTLTSSTTWSNTNKKVNGYITVPSGMLFRIQNNSLIEFDENSGIIVEIDAKLLISNSTLKDHCDVMWGGLIIKGNDGLSQSIYNQGMLIMNNSTLKNSMKAADIYGGGIAQISYSHFYNNYRGLYFRRYDKPNICKLRKNDFKTTSALINTWLNPDYHIYFYRIHGIKSEGNRFENSIGSSSPSHLGFGIKSTNSDIEIVPHSDGTINTFKNLYYGVYSTAFSLSSIKMLDNFFDNNYRGAYIAGNTNVATIYRNNFDVGNMGLSPITPPPYLNIDYGLYLNGCTTFEVQENNFYDGVAGLYVNNSGVNFHKVYNNTFTNINNLSNSGAAIALNLNSLYIGNSLSGQNGLVFICNEFIDNSFDISVINGRIRGIQGNYNGPSSRNTFDHNSANCPDGENAFFTNTDPNFNTSAGKYLYLFNQIGDATDFEDCYTSDYVDKSPIGSAFNESQCQSLTGIDDSPFSYSISNLAYLNNEINLETNNLNNLIDGGNTIYLLDLIASITHKNFKSTCNELLNFSPYLSDEVLIQFITLPEMYNPVKKREVIMANSPLPKSVLPYLEQAVLPPPFISSIYSNQNGINERESIEFSISDLENQKTSLLSSIYRIGVNKDSIVEVRDTLIEVFAEYEDLNTKVMLFDLLIGKKMLSEAAQIRTEIEGLLVALPEGFGLEVYNYLEMQNIISEYLAQDGDSTIVIEENLEFITDLANCENCFGQTQAQVLLGEKGVILQEQVLLPEVSSGGAKSTIISNINENNQAFSESNCKIDIFPNPANEKIFVDFGNSESYYDIELFSIDGKLMSKFLNKQNIFQIDIECYESGLYYVLIKENSIFVKKELISKIQ